jgi:hypothetical protein
MKPQDAFGVVLRSLAVWLCIWGTWNTLAGIKFLVLTLASAISGTGYRHESFGYFVYSFPALISGVIILAFADFFVSLTYRSSRPPSLPDPSETSKIERDEKR